ncbi:phosphotransferase [Pectobacterium sp. A535-S3-A17]|uniref:phosphotransferase family protein n=1 Tax=Pectobacterium quasiaquaticum TaxID=2774015 RepID=UPI001873517E|nr:phosphotransferase [Pectobacterium quasiaquaticum]MBE5212256.1 phosphotransferase [Pectobacterium quasiaquaticum]MBE5225938.1 phosphotransferase [Pectobacterium quasiaquaticum]
MRLTLHNLAHFLVDNGFLHPEYLVSGRYKVIQRQSRNSIFQVFLDNNPSGLFVKQLLSSDQQNAYLMQKDATVHCLIQQTDILPKMRAFIPNYYGYELGNHVFVTEFFPGAISLHEFITQSKSINQDELSQMATILASLHKDLSEEIEDNPSLNFFNRQPPWIMLFGDRDNPQIKNSQQHLGPIDALIRQQPDIPQLLEDLRYTWSGNTLIHGDIKLVNFIRVDQKKTSTLKLIDWEIADLGDPMWDVAGLLQSFLTLWVFSQNPNPMLQHQPQPGMEFLTWEQTLSACQFFWLSYCKARDIVNPDAALNSAENRQKLTHYTAARMLQTAFESNISKAELQPSSNRIVQMVTQMIVSPQAWATQILGAHSHEL